MPFCGKCGNHVKYEDNFCKKCGNNVQRANNALMRSLHQNSRTQKNRYNSTVSHGPSSSNSVDRIFAEMAAHESKMNAYREMDTYISQYNAFCNAPERLTTDEEFRMSIYQDRMNHAIEDYIEAFKRHYSAGEMNICETMMYVASHRAVSLYYGSKYPFKMFTHEIIKKYVANVRDYDHTGRYEP